MKTKRKNVPPVATRFKKGQTGNPKGRPPDALNALVRRLTASEFADMADMIVQGNLSELQRIGKDPNSSALRVLISAVMIKAIQKGDHSALDSLLNRIVGKVKDRLEVAGVDGGPVKLESKLAVQKLMEDPESFAHLAALEGKLNGNKPATGDQ